MSRRLGLGLAIVTALSLAAVAVAILSAHGPGDFERIKGAIPWPARCVPVAVQRPSRAPIMRRWASLTVQTADIVCAAGGPRVAYARFADAGSVDRALATSQPSRRYCRIAAAIVVDGLTGADSTVFSDMCRNLGGTFVGGP